MSGGTGCGSPGERCQLQVWGRQWGGQMPGWLPPYRPGLALPAPQAYHPHSVTALQSPSLIGGREANRVRGGPDRGGCLCWEGGGQGQQASAEEGQRGPRGRGHTGAKLSNPSEHTGPEWREVLHGWSLGWAQRWGQWVRVRLGQQGPGHLRLGAQWS